MKARYFINPNEYWQFYQIRIRQAEWLGDRIISTYSLSEEGMRNEKGVRNKKNRRYLLVVGRHTAHHRCTPCILSGCWCGFNQMVHMVVFGWSVSARCTPCRHMPTQAHILCFIKNSYLLRTSLVLNVLYIHV